MFAAVCFLGKYIVPKMCVFRRQFFVIQCMLIVMKLSDAGLIQKSVLKIMFISAIVSSVSHLMSTRNARICSSTNLVTFCLDVLGHLGSHYLINITNPVQVHICKGKLSKAHKRTNSPMYLFVFVLLHPYSSMHLSSVLCP